MNRRDETTIDRELAYYERMAATWWDESGPFWPLHRLNQLRIRWILARLADLGMTTPEGDAPLHGLEVLDIGCGGGILSEALARAGARVTGIDVVERNIAIARAHAGQSGLPVTYCLEPAAGHAAGGRTYDVVFNMEVVEHVADFPAFMRQCQSLVRPGGVMFVATINRNPLAWLVAIIGAEYILGWLPRGTHHYRLLRRPDEVTASLTADGFREVARTGVAMNPFTRQLSLVRSLWVNYMLCAVRGQDGTGCARPADEDAEF